MTSVRVQLTAACMLGTALGIAVAAGTGPPEGGGLDVWAIARGLVVASYVLVGAYTWWQRPSNRLGSLLAAVGFLYAGASFAVSSDDVVRSAGRVVLAAFFVALTYVFLCFPYDRLSDAFDRRFVRSFAAATVVVWLPASLVASRLPAGGPLGQCYGGCPPNGLRLIQTSSAVTTTVSFLITVVTTVALATVTLRLGTKARASHVRRRLYRPVFAAAIALALSTIALGLFTLAGTTSIAVRVVGAIGAVAVPVAFLVGQVHGRVFAATRFGELMTLMPAATPADIEGALADVLGDPSLTLAIASNGGGFVDVRGNPIELPVDGDGREATIIRRGGEPVGALVHDRALHGDTDVMTGLGSGTLALLDNVRLVSELRASRARIVEAAQTERLRLERNLHDGAQQHLLRVQMSLHDLRRRVRDDELAVRVGEIEDAVGSAAAELVALAQGLYPAILRERGLSDALRAHALMAPLPVTVVARDVGRIPAPIEEAVYYCVLEAVQNGVKHGGDGTTMRIALTRSATQLELEVRDSGRGFVADRVQYGMGLVGMHDRIGAVGGDVVVSSRPGAGTVVHAVVPLRQTAARG